MPEDSNKIVVELFENTAPESLPMDIVVPAIVKILISKKENKIIDGKYNSCYIVQGNGMIEADNGIFDA
jgi:hypothetical protein